MHPYLHLVTTIAAVLKQRLVKECSYSALDRKVLPGAIPDLSRNMASRTWTTYKCKSKMATLMAGRILIRYKRRFVNSMENLS